MTNDKADSMRNAAPLQVESNAVRAEKIRKAAVHDEFQQSLMADVEIRLMGRKD